MSIFRVISSLLGGKRVVYGTSDHLLNFGEVLLTVWVAEAQNARPVFFNYPKGWEWVPWEIELFEPYQAPPWDPGQAFKEAGLSAMEVLPLHQMVVEGIGDLSLGEIAERIRLRREIKTFRALNLPDQKPVYVSSKDRRWAEWSGRHLEEVINDPRVKLGGSMIYFIYGAFLARNPGCIGLLPGKQKSDVLGAFEAGRKAGGGGGRTLHTGEFDFMTARQWSLWRGDNKWRKAPFSAIRRLLKSPFAERVRDRLLVGEYCPLAYDEKADRFFFWEV